MIRREQIKADVMQFISDHPGAMNKEICLNFKLLYRPSEIGNIIAGALRRKDIRPVEVEHMRFAYYINEFADDDHYFHDNLYAVMYSFIKCDASIHKGA